MINFLLYIFRPPLKKFLDFTDQTAELLFTWEEESKFAEAVEHEV
jgi:hypothetical protein